MAHLDPDPDPEPCCLCCAFCGVIDLLDGFSPSSAWTWHLGKWYASLSCCSVGKSRVGPVTLFCDVFGACVLLLVPKNKGLRARLRRARKNVGKAATGARRAMIRTLRKVCVCVVMCSRIRWFCVAELGFCAVLTGQPDYACTCLCGGLHCIMLAACVLRPGWRERCSVPSSVDARSFVGCVSDPPETKHDERPRQTAATCPSFEAAFPRRRGSQRRTARLVAGDDDDDDADVAVSSNMTKRFLVAAVLR